MDKVLVLHNKFKVVKTKEDVCKKLRKYKVGDILEISTKLEQRYSCGSSATHCIATLITVDGVEMPVNTIERYIRYGDIVLEEV